MISINAISREPGHRSKIAVSSIDAKVDCVGACVGVRGNRIKTIIEELHGERIDIVRFDEDPQVLIPNSLQPAEVDEVILCQMLGRAIVLVREDQLSLAIGKRGQNVRLGSKLCGWDIEIMTQEELEQQIDKAVTGFCTIKDIDTELANRLVGEGYLSYDDLSVIEPDDLMEMGSLTAEQVDQIVEKADEFALEAEKVAIAQKAQRRAEDAENRKRESEERAKAAKEEAAAKEAAAKEAAAKAEAEAPAAAEPTVEKTEATESPEADTTVPTSETEAS